MLRRTWGIRRSFSSRHGERGGLGPGNHRGKMTERRKEGPKDFTRGLREVIRDAPKWIRGG